MFGRRPQTCRATASLKGKVTRDDITEILFVINNEDGFAHGLGSSNRVHRSSVYLRLDNEDGTGQSCLDPVTGDEVVAVHWGADRVLGKEQASCFKDLCSKVFVLGRIDSVQTVRKHGGGQSASCYCAFVACRIAAKCEATHDVHPKGCEGLSVVLASCLSFGRRFARTDDRERWPVENGKVSLVEDNVRNRRLPLLVNCFEKAMREPLVETADITYTKCFGLFQKALCTAGSFREIILFRQGDTLESASCDELIQESIKITRCPHRKVQTHDGSTDRIYRGRAESTQVLQRQYAFAIEGHGLVFSAKIIIFS